MPVWVSLLRGINVGGNKIIRMADLRALYASAGFTDITTLLQSGNVVFHAAADDAAHITATIEQAIRQAYGFEAHVILRRPADIRRVIAAHPFSDEQLAEPGKIMVTFWQQAPAADAVQNLLDSHAGPEIIYPAGSETYTFYADGMGRSKLSQNALEKALRVIGTGRNWNTVNKLLAAAE